MTPVKIYRDIHTTDLSRLDSYTRGPRLNSYLSPMTDLPMTFGLVLDYYIYIYIYVLIIPLSP